MSEQLNTMEAREQEMAERRKPSERQERKVTELLQEDPAYVGPLEEQLEADANRKLPGPARLDSAAYDDTSDKPRPYEEARDPLADEKHHGYKEPKEFRDIVTVNREAKEEPAPKPEPPSPAPPGPAGPA